MFKSYRMKIENKKSWNIYKPRDPNPFFSILRISWIAFFRTKEGRVELELNPLSVKILKHQASSLINIKDIID